MSDQTKAFTNTIFGLFGGMYEGAIQRLAKQAPEDIKKILAALIEGARIKSGLSKERSLQLLKYLRDVLTHIIDNEK